MFETAKTAKVSPIETYPLYGMLSSVTVLMRSLKSTNRSTRLETSYEKIIVTYKGKLVDYDGGSKIDTQS